MNEKPNAATTYGLTQEQQIERAADGGRIAGERFSEALAAPNLPDSETRESLEAIMSLAARYRNASSVQEWEALANLRAAVERVIQERDLARDGWHQANGVADLAIKHRNEAEQEAAALRELLAEARPFVGWTGAPDDLLARIHDATSSLESRPSPDSIR